VKTVQDFNYKVALASGLKHLQSGKLRQAEEQFRYLVSKFPRADGGYRGLARVFIELGDRAAALGTLREGAAALARGGERAGAIELLREAVTLDPLDLAAHRRLAAAFSLAGDANAAAQEYVRFTQVELAAGDPERARLEASYAIETLGEIPALHDVARSVGLTLRTVGPQFPPGGPAAEVTRGFPEVDVAAERTAAPGYGGTPEYPAAPALDERAALFGGLAGAEAPAPPAGSVIAEASTAREDLLATPAPTEWITAGAEAVPATAPPVAPAAPAPAVAPVAPDALALEERAAALIARKHPEAGKAAIEAASALLEAGKVTAASDLLLALVASGTAVHDAEIELIGVATSLGRRDVAAQRAELLARVMRLAGDDQRAAEIERVAQTL
jgi:thioredoxin-like negative regulator of GroEL